MKKNSKEQIESEIKRQRLTDTITRWCIHTKTKPILRDHDIPSLVGQILEEFYHIRLCCGHLVRDFDESVSLAFKENDGSTVYGSYCKVCAEEYKKELGAWKVKDD